MAANTSEIPADDLVKLAEYIKCPYGVQGSKLKCLMCHVTKTTEKDLGIHLRADHKVKENAGPWVCPMEIAGCRVKALFKDNLYTHVYNIHYCPICRDVKPTRCDPCTDA